MKRLYVHYEDTRVGILVQDDQLVYSFTYDDGWLTNPAGFPLSISMPLQKSPFGNKTTLSFFENLLPEGDVRERIKRRHHIEGILDLLNQFGQDCAGAVVVADTADYASKVTDAVRELEMEVEYSAINQHESVAAAISSTHDGYLSLAGAQDKFPAIFLENKLYLPIQGAPTTHIVKTPILSRGIDDSVANEYFCMELARAIGLDVPQCGIIEGKVPLFIIERYDRYRDEKGRFHRIHQQDFCQALGYTSEEKYESIGGPSIKQCFDLIKNHVSAKERIAAIQRFIDWICFNLFIGNNDSHAKNISLIQRSGTNSLAPFYDLLSTEIYPTLGKKFAFVIGDPRIVGQLGKSQFLKLENQLQVKEGAILKRMKKIGDAILSHKDRLVQDVEKKLPNSTIQKKISRFIEERYQGFQYHRIVP